MYPLHVDKVESMARRSLLGPGPGNYELPSTFGREGQQKTFGTKLPADQKLFKAQKNIPGPGNYPNPDQVIDKFSFATKAKLR